MTPEIKALLDTGLAAGPLLLIAIVYLDTERRRLLKEYKDTVDKLVAVAQTSTQAAVATAAAIDRLREKIE